MNDIQNAAIVAAVVTAIKSFVPDKVQGWITVAVAAAVGAGLAYVQNGDVVTGIYSGLVAAGVITVAKSVGK